MASSHRNLFDVKIREECSPMLWNDDRNSHMMTVTTKRRTVVSIRGPFGLMFKRKVRSLEKFCEFTEQDADSWALAAGLCDVVYDHFEAGDKIQMSHYRLWFAEAFDAGLQDRMLICVSSPHIDCGAGMMLFTTLEFVLEGEPCGLRMAFSS